MIQKFEEDVAGHGVVQLFALCTKALTNSPQPAVHAACQIQKLCQKLCKGQAGQAGQVGQAGQGGRFIYFPYKRSKQGKRRGNHRDIVNMVKTLRKKMLPCKGSLLAPKSASPCHGAVDRWRVEHLGPRRMAGLRPCAPPDLADDSTAPQFQWWLWWW